VAGNFLNPRSGPWSAYPVGAIAAALVLAEAPRRLPRPREAYLVLLLEGVAAAYVGLVALLAPSGLWFVEYVLPSLVLGGGAVLGLQALLRKRSFKKSYVPFALQSVLAVLCYPLALLSTDAEGSIYGGIVAFFGAVALFYIGKASRRWWRSEARRKLSI